jgi:hypothetical protein
MQRSARIDALKRMLETEPMDLFTNYALGIEYANDSEALLVAQEQFKKVIDLDSDYIAAYYQLGKLFGSQAKPGFKKQNFKKTIKPSTNLTRRFFYWKMNSTFLFS